jgi:hypothetical protein
MAQLVLSYEKEDLNDYHMNPQNSPYWLALLLEKLKLVNIITPSCIIKDKDKPRKKLTDKDIVYLLTLRNNTEETEEHIEFIGYKGMGGMGMVIKECSHEYIQIMNRMIDIIHLIRQKENPEFKMYVKKKVIPEYTTNNGIRVKIKKSTKGTFRPSLFGLGKYMEWVPKPPACRTKSCKIVSYTEDDDSTSETSKLGGKRKNKKTRKHKRTTKQRLRTKIKNKD